MSLHNSSLVKGVFSPSPQTAAAAILFIVASLYFLRLCMLPKPIPGIPYNPKAANSLLGDVMALQNEMPDNISEWIIRQTDRHRSPIFQVFLVPFSKPFVIVSDFRESQDILVRRPEFQRSDISIALLGGELPNFHACLKTGPVWQARRRLLQDLMSPEFLNKVAVPNMYASACRLLELWRIKRDIAGTGRPFEAGDDLKFSTLDAIYDFGYGDGTNDRALRAQLELFHDFSEDARVSIRKSAAPGGAVDFPRASLGPAMDAVLRTTENITMVAATGFPAVAWRVLSWIPRVRRLRRLKDEFIKGQVDAAIARLEKSDPGDGDSKLKCALDLILQRERALAAKEGRKPVYWSETIKDEMFGFVTAGHETIANVLAWGVKFMADNPQHQSTLRAQLHAAHRDAVAEGRLPTHAEITRSKVAHLSAYVEEILRLAHATAMTDRQCTEDTVVLGRAIPRGTTVVVVNKGPGFTSPSLPIEEGLRSEASQKALLDRKNAGFYSVLGEHDRPGEFDPRRWLVEEEGGGLAFDATAFPTIPFGLGQRACFGRRMVYIQLKMLVTLLVWQFEFLACPPELSIYEAVQYLTNQPRKCYIALREL